MTGSGTYWPLVQHERDRLAAMFPDPGTSIFIANLRGGRVVAALRETVARALVDGTHRLATESEIAAFDEDQIREARTQHALERTRRPLTGCFSYPEARR